MRYIDATALVKAVLEERDKIPLKTTERYGFGVEVPYRHGESMRGGIRKALRCIETAPTVDVVPMDFHERCMELEVKKRIAAEKAARAGWISVDERLPEVGVRVLFACCEYIKDENGKDKPVKFVEYGYRIGKSWISKTSSQGFSTDVVTHWMDIPEPPKEE